jgi:Secretion system C-terminal sorting domain
MFMKYTLLLSYLLASFGLFSQNWTPVAPGEKLNYRHADSILISHTILIDSVRMDGQDSLFFLNRVVKRCANCLEINGHKAWLRNQGQFLQKVMRKKPNGQYVFEGEKTLLLLPSAAVGTSWVFDADNSISANVLTNQVATVFGFPDSVKTIALSNGINFQLSKSFGLLSFPEDSVGNLVALVGLEGPNLGESLPTYRDFFNFQAGDVFQYNEDYSNYPVVGHEQAKFSILRREESGDTLRYYVRRNRHVSETYFGNPSNNYSRTDSLIWNFTPDSIPWVNYYPRQLYHLNVFNSNNYSLVHLYNSPEFGVTKTLGRDGSDLYPVPFEPSPFPDSDTMRYWFVGKRIYAHSVGLGETGYFSTLVSGYFDRKLIGYLKNGDTTGILYPDFTTGTNAPDNEGLVRLEVLENPVLSFLTLEIHLPDNEEGIIKIINTNGQLVYQEEVGLNEQIKVISLSGFNAGVYWVRLEAAGQVVVKKIIVL